MSKIFFRPFGPQFGLKIGKGCGLLVIYKKRGTKMYKNPFERCKLGCPKEMRRLWGECDRLS